MRVLVVEDELHLAQAIALGLSEEGFTVNVALDGQEGLWRVTEHDYDVIVLDIMLPKLSGYELLRQIRARDVWTPVLMLTAKDGEYDLADALDLGADDYLTKPFSYVVLVARLRALLRRGSTPRPAIITVGDLSIDPASRQCTRNGVAIELTTREFALLEYLARHPNVVLSKSDILDHVWDEHFAGDPNIVEVYIRYLRRKIDVAFGCDSIKTVRLAGYRLVPDTAT